MSGILTLLTIGALTLLAGVWTIRDPRPIHHLNHANERVVRWYTSKIGLSIPDSQYDFQRRLMRWAVPASLIFSGTIVIFLGLSLL